MFTFISKMIILKILCRNLHFVPQYFYMSCALVKKKIKFKINVVLHCLNKYCVKGDKTDVGILWVIFPFITAKFNFLGSKLNSAF